MPKAKVTVKKKILIIEDDKNLIKLLKESMPAKKYKIILALEGQEGIAKTKEELPDLVLLDILLPGISGFDYLKKIKGDETTKKIPVIILSNLGQDQEIQIGLKLGAVDYLVKSDITIDQVVAKVNKFIEQK